MNVFRARREFLYLSKKEKNNSIYSINLYDFKTINVTSPYKNEGNIKKVVNKKINILSNKVNNINNANNINQICDNKFLNDKENSLEKELIEAMNNEEFEVYYQPIYDLKRNKVVEAEALIRWIQKDKIVSPAEFLPLAKKNGSIIRIDKFVIREATRYCKEIIESGAKDFKISINVSHEFLKRNYSVKLITNIVKEEGVKPNSIKIEITEDENIDNIEYAREVLSKLREIGFSIALDDFGVGYSYFNYLRSLPLDTLKIDKSLLQSIENDKKTIAIIKMLIDLSKTLELDIICEGVEEKNQMELLRKLKCNKIQGYYISKPLNKKDFSDFMTKTNK